MRTLETERLYLRPLKRDDLEGVHRMHSDPETVRFVSGRTKSDYGFGELGLGRLISIIHPENLASRRVAEKTGLRVERPAIHKGFDVVIYAVESHTPTAR